MVGLEGYDPWSAAISVPQRLLPGSPSTRLARGAQVPPAANPTMPSPLSLAERRSGRLSIDRPGAHRDRVRDLLRGNNRRTCFFCRTPAA